MAAPLAAQKVSDSVEMILEAHFEAYSTKNMEKLIAAWKIQDINDGGKKAIQFLYKAINDDFDGFMLFIDDEFSEEARKENRFCKATHKMFEVCARHASGAIEDSDPLFIQSRVLSDLAPDILKTQIGAYFKMKSNEFFEENYRDVLKDLGLVIGDNDNIPGVQIGRASAEMVVKKFKVGEIENGNG